MDSTIDETVLNVPVEVMLEKWPGISRVFINYRMSCIGCPFSKFHTLQDTCEIYQLDAKVLLGQVQERIETVE
jgi:hybrid cluster-associated redox disulfide protein